MSHGWNEVARLGGAGARYPHVLADAHGWCLRMGPRPRTDEKYFANLPSLLQGLLEHSVRRRLMAATRCLDLPGFIAEVKGLLRSVLRSCRAAPSWARPEAPARRGAAPGGRPKGPTTLSLLPSCRGGVRECLSNAPSGR